MMTAVMTGVERIAKVSSMNVFRTNSRSITFAWICTKMSGSSNHWITVTL